MSFQLFCQTAHGRQGRAVAGGIVRRRHEDETGPGIHQGKQGIEVETVVRGKGAATRLHPADPGLYGIQAEADHGMFARYGQHADQHVDDLVRAVADDDALRGDMVRTGQGFPQRGIAALRIAEGLFQTGGEHLSYQRRYPQRVFVAGHLDDTGKPVALPDLGNGHAGNIGAQAGYLRAYGTGVHGVSSWHGSFPAAVSQWAQGRRPYGGRIPRGEMQILCKVAAGGCGAACMHPAGCCSAFAGFRQQPLFVRCMGRTERPAAGKSITSVARSLH